MSIFKFITTSQLRKVLSAIHQRFIGVEQHIDTALSESVSDWDESDSTSGGYIKNRTHYKISKGFMSSEYTLIRNGRNSNNEEIMTIQDAINYDYISTDETISGNNYDFVIFTYPEFGNEENIFLEEIPDYDWGKFVDTKNPEVVAIVNGVNQSLTCMPFNSDWDLYCCYNNDIEIDILIERYQNAYYFIGFLIYCNSSIDTTSFKIKFKLKNEKNGYKTLDNNYLNGSLIAKGSGFNSEVFNSNDGKEAIGDQSHVEGLGSNNGYKINICMSGPTGTTEYTAFMADENPIRGINYIYNAIGKDIYIGTSLSKSATILSVMDIDDYLYKIIVDKSLNPYSDYSENICYFYAPGTVAIGHSSHVEGYNNWAIGNSSHAEGHSTIAEAESSHSEGSFTKATGYYSHAEGYSTTSSGHWSHAEGCNATSSGNYSHAEGYNTTSSGYYSHAEGYNTTAQRRSQHVFGEYNVLDTIGTNGNSKGDYIEIVGKGTSNSSRSNARTLDWSGNEILAGKLTVGAGPTNNMDVATKQYVDNAVSGGSGGGTTYSLSMTGNVITLTGGDGSTSTVTLPIYNGEIWTGGSY